MKTNLHLVFGGRCTEAFAFYATVFHSKAEFRMTYGEAPEGFPVPEGAQDLVMHMAMPLGSITLMGCDAPPHMERPKMGGFHISVEMPEEGEVRRIFNELSDGGSVQMPLTPTFWTPLFAMCTDKFGVEWMLSMPGPEM